MADVGQAELASAPGRRPRSGRCRPGRSARWRRAARPIGPWATSLPSYITPTWLHIWSTSASRWLDTSTVDPVGGQVADQVPHLAGALRVEAVGRLVEHQQVARHQQGVGDGQPLPHAERVRPVALLRRGQQPDPVQRGVDPGPRTCAGRWPGRPRPAGPGWPARRGRGGRPAPRPGRRPGAARVPAAGRASDCAEQPDLARGGRDQPEQHPDGGGLAGAVGPEEAVHRAARAPRGRSGRRRSAAGTAWSGRW